MGVRDAPKSVPAGVKLWQPGMGKFFAAAAPRAASTAARPRSASVNIFSNPAGDWVVGRLIVTEMQRFGIRKFINR